MSSFLLSAVFVVAGVGSAAAQAHVDDALKTSVATGKRTQRVIITVAPGHENEILSALRHHGDVIKSQHPLVHGLAAEIHSEDVSELAAHGGVVSIAPDAIVHVPSDGARSRRSAVKAKVEPNQIQGPAVSTLRQTLGLSAGSSGNLAAGAVNGRGIGVVLIDSGIAPNDDLSLSRITAYDLTTLAPGQPLVPSTPYDDFGHGTHVAGLIGGSGVLSGYMFQGVAPAVRLISFKVLDANGAGSTSNVIAAIEFVIANKAALGAQIINLSLGHAITSPAKFDPLVVAVEQASAAGIVVVVAAGNEGPGYGSINSPANAPSAIAVGAVDTRNSITRADDAVASFSSRGPSWFDGYAKPDVVAPGVNLFSDTSVLSTLYLNSNITRQRVGDADLLNLNGTSMAAGVASGVVALQLDANIHQGSSPLTPNAAKAILEYSALRLSTDYDYLTQGAGQINAAGAAQLAGAINTTARVNSWWLNTGVPGYTTIGGKPYSWAANIVWGTKVLGGQFIYYNNIVFGTNIVWGTGVVRGGMIVRPNHGHIVRGTNIVWGTHFDVKVRNIVWGTDDHDNIVWGTHLAPGRVLGKRVGGNDIIWATDDNDNIVWGTLRQNNIVWGTYDNYNIVWGTWDRDKIIWGTTKLSSIVNGKSDDNDNIVWGTDDNDNIVWGTDDNDNIVWGTDDNDNIVWGTSAGGVF